jgi:hypothetical protein
MTGMGWVGLLGAKKDFGSMLCERGLSVYGVWGRSGVGVPACVCVGMDEERCLGVPPVRELVEKDGDL